MSDLASWLGGSMPTAPIAGRVNRLMKAKPQACKRPKAIRAPAAPRKPKAAEAVEWSPPVLVPSLRARFNELLLRRLDIAIPVARCNNRLAERLQRACIKP